MAAKTMPSECVTGRTSCQANGVSMANPTPATPAKSAMRTRVGRRSRRLSRECARESFARPERDARARAGWVKCVAKAFPLLVREPSIRTALGLRSFLFFSYRIDCSKATPFGGKADEAIMGDAD